VPVDGDHVAIGNRLAVGQADRRTGGSGHRELGPAGPGPAEVGDPHAGPDLGDADRLDGLDHPDRLVRLRDQRALRRVDHGGCRPR
jgi:hypothetical protein